MASFTMTKDQLATATLEKLQAQVDELTAVLTGSTPKTKEDLLIWLYAYKLGVNTHGDPMEWDVSNLCSGEYPLSDHEKDYNSLVRLLEHERDTPEIAKDFITGLNSDKTGTLRVGINLGVEDGSSNWKSSLPDIDIATVLFDKDGNILDYIGFMQATKPNGQLGMAQKRSTGGDLFVDKPGKIRSNVNPDSFAWSGDNASGNTSRFGDSHEDMTIKLNELPVEVDTVSFVLFSFKKTFNTFDLNQLHLNIDDGSEMTPLRYPVETRENPGSGLLVATLRRNPGLNYSDANRTDCYWELQRQCVGLRSKKFDPETLRQIATESFKYRLDSEAIAAANARACSDESKTEASAATTPTKDVSFSVNMFFAALVLLLFIICCWSHKCVLLSLCLVTLRFSVCVVF